MTPILRTVEDTRAYAERRVLTSLGASYDAEARARIRFDWREPPQHWLGQLLWRWWTSTRWRHHGEPTERATVWRTVARPSGLVEEEWQGYVEICRVCWKGDGLDNRDSRGLPTRY